jgi:hypothetical protein
MQSRRLCRVGPPRLGSAVRAASGPCSHANAGVSGLKAAATARPAGPSATVDPSFAQMAAPHQQQRCRRHRSRGCVTPLPVTAARWLLRPTTRRPRPGATVARTLAGPPGVRLAPTSSARATKVDSAPGGGCSRLATSGARVGSQVGPAFVSARARDRNEREPPGQQLVYTSSSPTAATSTDSRKRSPATGSDHRGGGLATGRRLRAELAGLCPCSTVRRNAD